MVVEVPESVAGRLDVQHAAALLVNLLARSKDFVTSIRIESPHTALNPRVLPPAAVTAQVLDEALIELADAVGDDAVPVVADVAADEIRLILGPGPVPSHGWRVHGAAWRGVATKAAIEDAPTSDLPFGPYVAACLGAAVVCWITRGLDWQGDHLELSAWDLTAAATHSSAPTHPGPSAVEVTLDLVLAGIGAVGTTFLLALWTCPGVGGTILAADDDIVDETNRNRCPLFFSRHAGFAKARVVDEMFPFLELSVDAHEGRAEAIVGPRTHLVSAVDRPESRYALQQRYPASIIQASTENVRIEMLRCDPTVPTACLRCYNPPRTAIADDELRRDFVSLDEAQLRARAAELGVDVAAVRDWIATGRCSEVTGELLARFRTNDDEEHAFSIGFASALAGVLLAAQAVKDALTRSGQLAPGSVPLTGAVARARFPLLDLDSRVAGTGRYGREERCPACAPDAPAAGIWRQRYIG